MRVGVSVIVGVFDAVGLDVGVGVLAGTCLGMKSVTEQASNNSTVQVISKSLRIVTSLSRDI